MTTILTLTAAEDCMVESGAEANNNKNGWPYDSLLYDASTGIVQRAYIRFPTPSLPAGAVVSSAYVEFWDANNSPGDRLIELRSAAGSWSETTITWNNQPGSTGATIAVRLSHVPGAYNVYSGFADTVSAWIAGTLVNYGLRMALNSEGSPTWNMLYYTREGANPPHLVVTYNVPPNAPLPIAPVSGSSLDLAATPTFSFTFSDADVSDALSTWAFKRKVGAGAAEWWNASTLAWQAGEVFNAQGPLTALGGGSFSYTFPVGKWTNGTTYDWAINTKDDSSTAGTYMAWSSVVGNTPPVVAVTAPSATITNTSRPTVTWTVTDAESDPQSHYQVKVFSAAQYGAGGFDPETSTPVYAKAETASVTDRTHTLTADLPTGTTYRFYVKAKANGQYSLWAYQQRAVTLTTPVQPTLTRTSDIANSRVLLTATVASLSGYTAAQHFARFEFSDDGGTTWKNVRGGSRVQMVASGGGAVASIYDYEVPSADARIWRANAIAAA